MRFVVCFAALLAAPFSVKAETIDLLVQRPAAAVDVYMLRSLSVDRFTGTDGRALGIALERELAVLREPGKPPLFEIFDSGSGEGSVSGRADVDVEEARYVENRRLCPGTFDPQAKCKGEEKIEVEVSCRSRIVSLDADIRVVRNGDGRVILNRDVPQRSEARWCKGDRAPGETQAVISDLVRRAATSSARDFAPYSNVLPVRIREDRKGLDKATAAQFKAAVVATRGDGREGCSLFEALEAVAPDHRPLIFNLALCAEARGDYVGAVAGYRRVGDRDALSAADRAADTEIAIKVARQRDNP